MLDLSSFKKAVDALERSLKAAHSAPEAWGEEFKETLRAGVIQSFEVAYEQSWKFIQRWLRENTFSEEAELPRTRKELFRLAARTGLIEDPSPWFDYGEARNLTSHTYDEHRAATVFETAVRFLPDARKLLARLEAAND